MFLVCSIAARMIKLCAFSLSTVGVLLFSAERINTRSLFESEGVVCPIRNCMLSNLF